MNVRAEPASLVFSPEMEASTKSFREAAALLRAMGSQLNDQVVSLLDDSSSACSGCGAVTYHNFPQRQMRVRLIGARDRLFELATELERSARDPAFLRLSEANKQSGISVGKS